MVAPASVNGGRGAKTCLLAIMKKYKEILTDDDPLEEKSDEEILALSVKHPSFFSVILDRYQEAFLRKAEFVLRNREDAEDIVQETFSKIYLHANKFKVRDGASFKSWGYKILLNTSFTRYKKMKRHSGAVFNPDPEWYEAMSDTKTKQFEKEELKDYVISVLSRMPDNLSRVLKLHFIEGRPQEEIARIEGVSVGAIKTRVHRAKKEFKKVNTAIS
jgi:RNA polymerase sigma-70 factor, ECF subfamily